MVVTASDATGCCEVDGRSVPVEISVELTELVTGAISFNIALSELFTIGDSVMVAAFGVAASVDDVCKGVGVVSAAPATGTSLTSGGWLDSLGDAG